MAKALWTCTALVACLVILLGSAAEAVDRSRSRAAGSPKRKKGKVVGLNGTSHVILSLYHSQLLCLYSYFARASPGGTQESVKLNF